MRDDQFTKLFMYMQKEFAVIDKRLEETATKTQANDLLSGVDGLAGQLTDYNQELILLTHKVSLLERWIKQTAEETGVKLPN